MKKEGTETNSKDIHAQACALTPHAHTHKRDKKRHKQVRENPSSPPVGSRASTKAESTGRARIGAT